LIPFLQFFTEESVSSWESSDEGYAGNDKAHREKLKNNNKENEKNGECSLLGMTSNETDVYSPANVLEKRRC